MFLSQISALDASSLTSIAAVMSATAIIVSTLIKPYISTVAALKRVPLIVYSIVIALALTLFANEVLHTLAGSGIWSLLFQSFISVLGAGGLYHLPGALQSVEDTASDSSGPSGGTPPSPPAASMRLAAMLAIGISALFVGGCGVLGQPQAATTPAQNLVVVEQAYSLALVGINFGIQSGAISPAEASQATPYLNAIEAALTAAEADVAAGKPSSQTDIDAAVAALNQLAPLLAKVKTPTTRPGHSGQTTEHGET